MEKTLMRSVVNRKYRAVSYYSKKIAMTKSIFICLHCFFRIVSICIHFLVPLYRCFPNPLRHGKRPDAFSRRPSFWSLPTIRQRRQWQNRQKRAASGDSAARGFDTCLQTRGQRVSSERGWRRRQKRTECHRCQCTNTDRWLARNLR